MGIFLLKTSWLWESRNLFMQMVQCFETYLLSFCNILTIKTKKHLQVLMFWELLFYYRELIYLSLLVIFTHKKIVLCKLTFTIILFLICSLKVILLGEITKVALLVHMIATHIIRVALLGEYNSYLVLSVLGSYRRIVKLIYHKY